MKWLQRNWKRLLVGISFAVFLILWRIMTSARIGVEFPTWVFPIIFTTVVGIFMGRSKRWLVWLFVAAIVSGLASALTYVAAMANQFTTTFPAAMLTLVWLIAIALGHRWHK